MRCPSMEEIFDLVRDLPGHEPAPGVRDHVVACPSCRETSRWIASVLHAAAVGPLPEPPAGVVDSAVGLAGPGPGASAPARARRSFAQLVQDTFGGAVPAGVRSTGTDERRLLFVEGDTEIDLSVSREPRADGCVLTGQVLVRGTPAELFAALFVDDRRVAHERGDEAGVFTFTDLPQGLYRLEIWVPAEGRIVHVPEVPCSLGDGR